MDSEGKFWFGIWSLVAGVISIITISVTIGYSYNNTLEVAALLKAPNPQAYSCALLTATGSVASERCTLLAQSAK